MFGLFPVGSEELESVVKTLEQTFGVNDGVIGLPRYENHNYCRVSSDVTGNWWFICSLWLAQYYTEIDKSDDATRIISWVQSHIQNEGILAEQISPIDETTRSVTPLTWSHAEYIATLLDTITEKKADESPKAHS